MYKKFKLYKLVNDNFKLLDDNKTNIEKFNNDTFNIDTNQFDLSKINVDYLQDNIIKKFNININDKNNIIKYTDISDGKIINIKNEKENMEFNMKNINRDNYKEREIKYNKDNNKDNNKQFISSYSYSYSFKK